MDEFFTEANKPIEKIKLPKGVFIFLLLTYTVPFFLYGTAAMITGGITFPEFISTISDFSVFILMIIQIIFPIVSYLYFSKKIYSYDGTSQSVDDVNKTIKIFENINIALPIILFSLSPFIYDMRNSQRGLQYAAFNGESALFYGFSLMLGLTLVFSLLTYIFFLESLEHSLTWLPYRQKDQTLSLVLRTIIVTFFALVGMILIIQSI